MKARWFIKPSKRVYTLLLVGLLVILNISQTSVSAINLVPSDLISIYENK